MYSIKRVLRYSLAIFSYFALAISCFSSLTDLQCRVTMSPTRLGIPTRYHRTCSTPAHPTSVATSVHSSLWPDLYLLIATSAHLYSRVATFTYSYFKIAAAAHFYLKGNTYAHSCYSVARSFPRPSALLWYRFLPNRVPHKSVLPLFTGAAKWRCWIWGVQPPTPYVPPLCFLNFCPLRIFFQSYFLDIFLFAPQSGDTAASAAPVKLWNDQ